MSNRTHQNTPPPEARLDRPCEHLALRSSADAPWGLDPNRSALDLNKDRAQHRRFHSFYEDLLN